MGQSVMRALLAIVVALSSAGCIDATDLPRYLGANGKPMDWETTVEPAMAPDFAGLGPSYPVLLIHQHHVPSERQKEEARRNPVVCARTDGGPLAFATRGPAMEDMAACAGPAADPPTGRLYVDRAEFEASGARGVAVLLDRCGGGAILLGGATHEFLVRTPAHDFLVTLLLDGTFLVDGVRVEPGTALKHGYYLHRGDRMDEEYVRVVFEAPGQWLRSRVAPSGDIVDTDIPARPTQGSGLVVDIGLAPPTLRAPIQAALAASGRHVEGILGLRAVHDGERLTEFTLQLATTNGAITWYGAGRTGDAMRLLGAADTREDAATPIPADTLLHAFDTEWITMRAGAPGTLTDVRLASDTSWGTLGMTPAPAIDRNMTPGGCDAGCVLVKQYDRWVQLLLPEKTPTHGARTLHVIASNAERDADVWWHVPE